MDLKDYKEAVDRIYHTMDEIHDDEMKRHVSGLLTLMLPASGDPRHGVVQALFDEKKNKHVDLLRRMYLLFGILLCNMGVPLDDAKRQLIKSYEVNGGDR